MTPPPPPARKPIPTNLTLDVQWQLLTRPELNPTHYVPLEHAALYPFDPAATTPSRVNAWWLAEAAWLSYWQDAAALRAVFADRAGMTVAPIDGHGTQGIVASGDRFTIIAFRGTQPGEWADLLSDVQFAAVPWDTGFVHQGFARALEAIRAPLEAALAALPAGRRVWFTGHSLGAAVATLAALRYASQAAGVYTIGSPRVGNGAFANPFNAQFDRRSLRYVHDHDVVTHVPPGLFAAPHGQFTHIDQLRWINPDGQIGPSEPTVPHFLLDVFGGATVLLDLIQANLRAAGRAPLLRLPAALTDHTPLYYVLHCWNDFATATAGGG